jgi:hypothetical protein
MTLKFLETVPSECPEFPFQAGQVITVKRLTAELKRWIARGAAVVLEDDPETAALGEPLEQATEPRPRPRGPR